MKKVFLAFAVLVAAIASADQTTGLKRVMRAKLSHSQAILGAVITSDWRTLDRESRALALATKDPAWNVLTAEEYLRQSNLFQRALQDLIEASAKWDLEAAADAHVSLTRSCVGCHNYLARRRVAERAAE